MDRRELRSIARSTVGSAACLDGVLNAAEGLGWAHDDICGAAGTLLPHPQRIYLKFGQPLATTRPKGVSQDKWTFTVRDKTRDALHKGISELLEIRADDPYHDLNPLVYAKAILPD
jgi:hypothetical protein